MERYLIDFDRRIRSVVKKTKAQELGIRWEEWLENVFLNEIPVTQFLTHAQLASCKSVDEVIEVLSKKERKPLTKEALLKRTQRTVKNVMDKFERFLVEDIQYQNEMKVLGLKEKKVAEIARAVRKGSGVINGNGGNPS